MCRRSLSLAAMGVVLALGAAPAAAQSADAVRAALLAPVRGWTMMWPVGAPPWAGVATVFFEARGDRLVAQIENHTYPVRCEQDVTVTAEGASFDLCREAGLVLRHQPEDREIPFRGRTAWRWFVFTAR